MPWHHGIPWQDIATTTLAATLLAINMLAITAMRSAEATIRHKIAVVLLQYGAMYAVCQGYIWCNTRWFPGTPSTLIVRVLQLIDNSASCYLKNSIWLITISLFTRPRALANIIRLLHNSTRVVSLSLVSGLPSRRATITLSLKLARIMVILWMLSQIGSHLGSAATGAPAAQTVGAGAHTTATVENTVPSVAYTVAGRQSSSTANSTLVKAVVGTEKVSTVYLVENYHQFTQPVNFDLLHKEIHGLRHLLRNINPKEVGEFSSIQGAEKHYLLSNTVATEGMNKLKCEEHDAKPITFSVFLKERLTVDRTIILADTVEVSDGYIRCRNHDSTINGVLCIRILQQGADAAKLIFLDKAEKYYAKQLLDEHPAAKMHLTVNATHIQLTEKPVGYTICQDNGNKSSSAKFAEIIKGKYFDHLGQVCQSILDSLDIRIETLQKTFILMIERQFQGFHSKVEFTDICKDIKAMSFADCIGTGFSPEASDNIFQEGRQSFAEIDEKIRVITKQAIHLCTVEQTTSHNFVYKVYTQYVNLHIALKGMMQAYLPTNGELDIKNILISGKTSGMDMQGCINQMIGTHLSPTETKNVLDAVYTSKVFFVLNFQDQGEIPNWFRQRPIKNTRAKRHLWTQPLAAVTGLAEQNDIGVLQRNTEKVLTETERNAHEITHLEDQANIVLNAMKSQNDNILRLYTDEKNLHSRLKSLMQEEESMTEHMAHVIDALEVLSDVDIEYSSFMSTLAILPSIIDTVESQVLSVITQSVRPEMIPFGATNVSLARFGIESFALVDVKATVTVKGFSLSFSLPEISTPYTLTRVQTLPFPLGNGVLQRFRIESDLVALNPQGYSFLYSAGTCPQVEKAIVCEHRQIELHARPTTCVEWLARDVQHVPKTCLLKSQILISDLQQYLYHENGYNVTVLSPYEDSATMDCRYNATTSSLTQLTLHEGLSLVLVPPGCKLLSTQLIIHSAATTAEFDGKLPTSAKLDLASEISTLSEYLEEIHMFNTTKLVSDFLDFASEVGVENADIDKVSTSISAFKQIKTMQGYHPLQITLEKPDAMSTTLTIVAWAVVLLALIVSITCCYMCCAPCKTCIDAGCSATSCIFSGLYKVICCLKKAAKQKHEDNESELDLTEKSASRSTIFSLQKTRTRRHSTSTAATELESEDAIYWRTQVKKDRVVLYASLPSGNIFYNLATGKVENADGNVLHDIKASPSLDKVNQALRKVKELPTPNIVIRDGKECLESDNSILYDRMRRSYRSRITGKIAGGFRLPSSNEGFTEEP